VLRLSCKEEQTSESFVPFLRDLSIKRYTGLQHPRFAGEKVLPEKAAVLDSGVQRVSCVNQPRYLFRFGSDGPHFQATGLPARVSHLAR